MNNSRTDILELFESMASPASGLQPLGATGSLRRKPGAGDQKLGLEPLPTGWRLEARGWDGHAPEQF